MMSSWIYKYPPQRALLESDEAKAVTPAELVAEELRLAYERGYRDAVQDVSRWGLDAVLANLSERGPV